MKGSYQSKTYLRVKTCPVCERTFNWRKKWKLVWDEVKYCSERCRKSRNLPDSQ